MDLTKLHCVPCEGGMPPMPDIDENEYIKNVPGWEILREKKHKLKREFKFKNFREAMEFINNVAEIAESEGHHPDIHIFYNRVQIELLTHAIGGLSENDFILASKINLLYD